MKLVLSKIFPAVMLMIIIAPSLTFAEVGAGVEGNLTKTGINASKIAAAAAAAAAADSIGTLFPPGALVAGTGPLIMADGGVRFQLATEASKKLADAKIGVLETILEAIEKTLFETLKKRILDMMVDQIIVWIQGGGQPQFVTDWQGFFQNAAKDVAGDFAKELGLGFLCSPFSVQLRLSVLPVERFTERAECTLDDIVGNIQDFYSDFRNGRWLAFDAGLQMNNNYFGSLWLAWDERNNRIADALFAKEKEAVTGAGFLSTKRCVDDIGQEVKETFPGAHCQIVTPGRVIGETVTNAIYGSGIGWLLSSDDLSHYVAAIANAAINRLISEGAKGLLGVSTPSAPRPERGRAPGGIYGAQNIPFGVADGANQLGNIQGDFAAQIAPLGNPYEQAQRYLEEHLTLQEQLKTSLQTLYDCQRTAASTVIAHLATDTKKNLDAQIALVNKLRTATTQNQEKITAVNVEIRSATSPDAERRVLATLSSGTSYAEQVGRELIDARTAISSKLDKANADLLVCKSRP